MAGGGKGGGKQTKSVQKAKDKIVEDRTFGLKNKNKSKVVQKYVQTVSVNVKGTNDKIEDERRRAKKAEKERMDKEAREMGDLFKPVVVAPKVPQQKLADGIDPKTVLCQYFKAGFCTRGKSCKFSHDLTLEGKNAKINLYNDPRDMENAGAEGSTMADWDEDKLKNAVETAEESRKKAGKLPPTKIICKYFLEAVENGHYGWFWKCPNGGDSCHYRHCLPPGFVLKDKKKKTDVTDEAERIALEEELENARTQIETRTAITPELFMEWRRKRQERRQEERRKQEEEAHKKKKGGTGKLMSGRDLFEYRPELFLDDENAAGTNEMTRGEQDYEPDIDESLFAAQDLDVLGFDIGDDSENLLVVESTATTTTTTTNTNNDDNANEGEAQFGDALPVLSDEQLATMPKRELIEMLKHFGDDSFCAKHQLSGIVKNVVKKKKTEELQVAYKELAAKLSTE